MINTRILMMIGLIVLTACAQLTSTPTLSRPNSPWSKVPLKPISEMSTGEILNLPPETIKEHIRQKKQLNKLVELKINPNLLQKNIGQEIDLTSALPDFSAKALPVGQILFQESFVLGSETLEALRKIPVSDPSKRFTLHVDLRSGPSSSGMISLNINGNDWLKERVFRGQATEIEYNTLLLNANNSLRIKLIGQAGDFARVSLIEAGDTGTALRQRGGLSLPQETQLTHTEQNDINVFNPSDPNSLGGLEPFQGDIKMNDGSILNSMQVNGGSQLKFQSSVLLIEFRDPQTDWPLFQAKYGASLLEEKFGRFLVKIDVTRAPVHLFHSLLNQYNEMALENIETVTFSSITSLQTFLILADALINHAIWFKTIELNAAGTLNQISPSPVPTASPSCPPNPDRFDRNQDWELVNNHLGRVGAYVIQVPGKSWWIKDSNLEQAWDYSIGTGARVAYVDSGFNVENPEISRRILSGPDYGNNDWPHQGDHGHLTLMMGFAEKDNDSGTAGSAPNAQVAPYHVNVSLPNTVDLSHVLYAAQFTSSVAAARRAKIDVIGSSTSFVDDWRWTVVNTYVFFPGVITPTTYVITGHTMAIEISAAIADDIPVLICAANYSKNYKLSLPGNLPGVIAVGAVEPRGNIAYPPPGPYSPALPNLRASVPKCEDDVPLLGKALEVSYFSNFGEDLIWGPGNHIILQGINPTKPISEFSGTSAATPFVTGIVALMKSRNPDLTIAEIKEVLDYASSPAGGALPAIPPAYQPKFDASGFATIDTSTTYAFPSNLINKPRYINAEAALSHPLVGAKKSQTYFAYVIADDSVSYKGEPGTGMMPGRKLRLNQFAMEGAPGTEKEKQIPQLTVSHTAFKRMEVGSFVRVKGWSDVVVGKRDLGFGYESIVRIGQGQIEISDVDEICDPTTICTIPRTTGFLFTPEIHNIQFDPPNPTASTGFNIIFTGQHLVAMLRDGFENARFTVEFQQLGITPPPAPVSIIVKESDVVSVANDGTNVFLRIPPQTSFPPGKYSIRLKGLGSTNLFSGLTAGGFQISSDGSNGCDPALPPEECSTPGFNIASIKPSNASPQISLWVVRDTQRLAVKPEYVVGVAINDQDLSQLQVLIKDGDTTIQANVVEIAQNFAAFKIPVGAQAGVKDLLLKIGAQQVLMEDALELQPADAVTAQFDQPSVYVYEKGNVVVKVRKPDGSTYPDGTPIYINVAGPGINSNLGVGIVNYHPDGAPAPSSTYYLTGGEVKFKVAAETRLPPNTMDGDNWPDWRSGHPNLEIRDVCLGAYSSSRGWHCSTRIGPTNPDEQPRLYVRDAYWVEGKREIPVQSGQLGYSQTLRIFDRAGIPVPNGSAMFFDGGYFSNFSIPPVTTGNEITVSIISQGAPCWGAEAGKPGALEGIILRSIYSLYPQVGDRLRNMDRMDEYSLSIRYYLGPGCN